MRDFFFVGERPDIRLGSAYLGPARGCHVRQLRVEPGQADLLPLGPIVQPEAALQPPARRHLQGELSRRKEAN